MVRPGGRPMAEDVRGCPAAEAVALVGRLTVLPTALVWLPGLDTVTVLPGLDPLGTVHCCCAEPLHVSMTSRAAVLPPGSDRHSPELGLSSEPLAWAVQPCALLWLQGYQ